MVTEMRSLASGKGSDLLRSLGQLVELSYRTRLSDSGAGLLS